MACNCKGNKQNKEVDELSYLELIKIGVIDGGKLSTNQKYLLYDYYNKQFNETVLYTCGNCWEAFIVEKLRELWTKRSLENLQS